MPSHLHGITKDIHTDMTIPWNIKAILSASVGYLVMSTVNVALSTKCAVLPLFKVLSVMPLEHFSFWGRPLRFKGKSLTVIFLLCFIHKQGTFKNDATCCTVNEVEMVLRKWNQRVTRFQIQCNALEDRNSPKSIN